MYKKSKIVLGALVASVLLIGSLTLPVRAAPSPPSIVFASNREGNLEIYAGTRDGSNIRRLTTNTTDDKEPAASPDGTRIVFAATDDENDTEAALFLLNLGTNQQTQLTSSNKIDYRNPAWSPDGTQIAFTSIDTQTTFESCITIMTIKTRQTREVTCSPTLLLSPDWSPDGSTLLFYEFNRRTGGKIYTIDTYPGATQQFIRNGSSATFSPQGDYIAFSGRDTTFTDQIFVAKADGSSTHQITTGSEIKTVADWADDDFITYAEFAGEALQVKSIRRDGTGGLALPHKGTSFELTGKGLLPL